MKTSHSHPAAEAASLLWGEGEGPAGGGHAAVWVARDGLQVERSLVLS